MPSGLEMEPGYSAVTATRRRRGWRFYFGFALYLVVVFIAVDYFFYLRYRDQIAMPTPAAELPSIDGVSARTIGNLGWALTDRSSNFTKYPREKPPGVLRIACFGNSFAYGDEVADGHDYPAILARLMRESGSETVEVLNFGSNWYGFHQSFLMWREVGEAYDPDIVLFGPAGLQWDRSTAFNHSGRPGNHQIHARFVLDDDAPGGVRLIEPSGGSNYAERTAAYTRFIPRWDYLRYDRNSPPFIAALLPEGQTLNPFYYHDDPAAEASELNVRLMKLLAASGRRVIVGHYDLAVVEEARRAGLEAVAFHRPAHFPYVAPMGHNSAFGNELLARQFLAMIRGDLSVELPVTKNLEPATNSWSGLPSTRSLRDFDSIVLFSSWSSSGESIPIGRFVRADFQSGSEPVVMEKLPYNSLIALKGTDAPFLDAAFVPLESNIDDGIKVMMEVQREGRRESRRFGSIWLMHPGLNLGALEPDSGLSLSGARLQANFLTDGDVVEISVAGNKILKGRVVDGSAWLYTIDVPFLIIRTPEGAHHQKMMPSLRGSYDFVLAKGGEVLRVPVANWQVESIRYRFDLNLNRPFQDLQIVN